MRNIFFVFALLSQFVVKAQKINENTVVKDSFGTVFPVALWRPLLMKGGHILKPENKNDPNSAFYLVRLTDEEKEARMAKMPPPKESKFFRKAEKFSLGKVTDLQGNKIDLKNNEGKITVVNFWFINCPPCRMEIPELNELVTKYASDSVRFVAIALDEKYELETFLKQMPFHYAIVDGGRNLAGKYGIQSYPTHAVIDQQGKVYFHTTGLSVNTVYCLEKSIRELLFKTPPLAVSGR